MEGSDRFVEEVNESQSEVGPQEKHPQLRTCVEHEVPGLGVQQSCAYISIECWGWTTGKGGGKGGGGGGGGCQF